MSLETKETPKSAEQLQSETDAHRDPLSGRAGAHPVGTGIGAMAGGITTGLATGAVVGMTAGPVGTVIGAAVGAAVGAVAGGMAGSAVSEEINPTVEHGFWSNTYLTRSYVIVGTGYDQYGPAYQYGWESQRHHIGKTFEESEAILLASWDKARGESKLAWQHAKEAVRDSWNRVATPKS